MLDYPLIEQLDTLKANIDCCEKDEVEEAIKKLSHNEQLIIQDYIRTLNSLLVDGKVDL